MLELVVILSCTERRVLHVSIPYNTNVTQLEDVISWYLVEISISRDYQKHIEQVKFSHFAQFLPEVPCQIVKPSSQFLRDILWWPEQPVVNFEMVT